MTNQGEVDWVRSSAFGPDDIARLVESAATDAVRLEPVELPWTGRPFYSLPHCGPVGVAAAVQQARRAQRDWAARPLSERRAILRQFQRDIRDRSAELLDLVQLETGKARRDALEEIVDIALVGRYYDKHAADLLRVRRRAGLVPFLTRVWELRRPVGVVGVIAPWNYPLTLAVNDAIPALLAGNAVVVKPDHRTSLGALAAGEALRRAGLPEGVFQVVPGDGPVTGAALVDNVDYLMFTGSTAAGRRVAARAGERLIGCTLELGGKNALLVLEDADVERAVQGIVRGCFANAGQLCIAFERVLVHERHHAAVRAALRAGLPELRMAPGLDWDADMGSLASRDQLEKVEAHVADALRRGGELLAGGSARPEIGPYFHEPTVVEHVPAEALSAREETFGPVVSLGSFSSDAEAVRAANRGDYGLNASVWTSDLRRGRRVAASIRAGTVTINDGYGAAWASVDAPMGGMGASGLGRRHGATGMLNYTQTQTVAAQAGHPLITPPTVDHGAAARAVDVLLRLLGP